MRKESVGLVALSQSKRLRELKNQVASSENSTFLHKKQNNNGVPEQQKIKNLVLNKIAAIKDGYPEGRQNKLFALRYGADDKLIKLPLKQLFKKLGITENLPKNMEAIIYESLP